MILEDFMQVKNMECNMNLLSFNEFIGESLNNLKYADFGEFEEAGFEDLFEKIEAQLGTDKFIELSPQSDGDSEILWNFLEKELYNLGWNNNEQLELRESKSGKSVIGRLFFDGDKKIFILNHRWLWLNSSRDNPMDFYFMEKHTFDYLLKEYRGKIAGNKYGV